MRLRVWVAGVVPLLGMGIASAVSTEPDAVAELAAIVARERAAIEARDWRRPGGMHESGLAEEAYWRANAAAIRGDWDTVFAELAIGGRRVDTRPELRWEGGPLRQLTDDNLYSFPHQAKERVLRFCSENRIDDALATALPALTFAVDLMRRPFLVEWMVGSVAARPA